jgi:hypothetical protein
MPRTHVTCCARQKAVPGIGSCAEVSEVSRPSAALGPALDPRFVGRASAKAHLDAHGHWLGKAEQEDDEQGEEKHANTAMQGKTAQSMIADVERRTRTGIMSLAWLCISAVNRVASCCAHSIGPLSSHSITSVSGPCAHGIASSMTGSRSDSSRIATMEAAGTGLLSLVADCIGGAWRKR